MSKNAASAHKVVEIATAEISRSEQLRDAFGLLSPADLSALIGVDERTLAGLASAAARA